MQARTYIAKYAKRNNTKAIIKHEEINATNKWVEYMLDRHEINKILMHSDFATKMDLLEVLQVLDRKIAWHFKHPNFAFTKATRMFEVLKNAPKVATLTTPKNVAKKQHKKR
jgi:hypothetical protein